jgi:hypothetical protein
MITDELAQVSRVLDYILAQSSVKRTEPRATEKPKRKPRKEKPQPQAEQLRLF